jgi:hypothetical protein
MLRPPKLLRLLAASTLLLLFIVGKDKVHFALTSARETQPDGFVAEVKECTGICFEEK